METTASTLTKNNVQVVQQALSNFQQGNIPAIINACTDDILFSSYKVPNAPFTDTFQGKEGIQLFFAILAQTVNHTHFEPTKFIAQDDSVMVLVHETGTMKNTGKSFDHKFCMHFKVGDGKIAYYRGFIDSYELYKSGQE